MRDKVVESLKETVKNNRNAVIILSDRGLVKYFFCVEHKRRNWINIWIIYLISTIKCDGNGFFPIGQKYLVSGQNVCRIYAKYIMG